jgi:ferric-dicitrate binding protein FerR (iron transport regulator)
MENNYLNYTIEDFSSDEYFIDWVLQPTPDTIAFWEAWQQAHPERKITIVQARQVVRLLHAANSSQPGYSEKQLNNALAAIHERIELPAEQYPEKEAVVLPLKRRVLGWQMVAASLTALLLISAFLYYLMLPVSMIEVATGNGEIRKVTLPDQSVVTLSHNSQLRYPAKWEADEPREVHFKGEGFFSVTHQHNNQKFWVNVNKSFKVEVLGTEFNITSRKNREKVVLKSGSIRLTIGSSRQAKENTILMKPGELVEKSDTSKIIIKKAVNPLVYSSWKDKEIVLDNTSLAELSKILQDTYGLSVSIDDESLLTRRYKGTFPSDNINVLIQALSKSFNVSIHKKQNQLIIKSN